MAMHTILREKRKSIGLTQEQVANYLGITTPAVNKWEKGTTCPDIALLPALARLLKTDPNTLLGFQESLSSQEIGRFFNDVTEEIKKNGLEQGFALALEKAREYPNCVELLHTTAMFLEGTMMMQGLTEEQKQPYESKLAALYESVAKSGDPIFADQARYLLASKRIVQEQYAEAQKLLDSLPDWSAWDKRGMQADLWSRAGETARAAELLERKLTMVVQDSQATLLRLIHLAVQEGDMQLAGSLADCAQKECEAFALGEYWSHIVPLEAAFARKEAASSIELLAAMLDALTKPWDTGFSPLFRHIPHQQSPVDMGAKLLTPLLSQLERAPEYEFLQSVPAFQQLLQSYRARVKPAAPQD